MYGPEIYLNASYLLVSLGLSRCILHVIVTIFTKWGLIQLYVHSFKTHFSLSFDGYINRSTVHV